MKIIENTKKRLEFATDALVPGLISMSIGVLLFISGSGTFAEMGLLEEEGGELVAMIVGTMFFFVGTIFARTRKIVFDRKKRCLNIIEKSLFGIKHTKMNLSLVESAILNRNRSQDSTTYSVVLITKHLEGKICLTIGSSNTGIDRKKEAVDAINEWLINE